MLFRSGTEVTIKMIILVGGGGGGGGGAAGKWNSSIPNSSGASGGGGGSGATASCGIETSTNGVIKFTITDGGAGYTNIPNVTIIGDGNGVNAVASLGNNKNVESIKILSSGQEFTSIPSVIIDNPSVMTGIGTYLFNEIVYGSISRTEARVKNWDNDTKVLKVSFIGQSDVAKGFYPGETIIGLQ